MHPPQASGCSKFHQGLQHSRADTPGARPWQHHERKLCRAVFSDVLAMRQDRAIAAQRQQRDAQALVGKLVGQLDAPQEFQVGRRAMSEMTLIEAVAVHRGKKARNAITIVRHGGTQRRLQPLGDPWLRGAHGRSPATNAAAARITAGSSSSRRWPSLRVSSSSALGQLSW